MKTIDIGLLGFGTVGSGVVKLLQENAARLERKVGAHLRIRRIAVRDLGRARPVEVDRKLLTANPAEVVADPAIQIVVEVMGGIDPARACCLEALEKGKHVVTANKALLATHGVALYRAAAEHRVDLGFEASVCGGIPVIRLLREGLVANRITSLLGIINGTCNYILTKMTEEDRPFAEVLAAAQARGYAEADPSLDVGGLDAAHKLQILASIAYDTPIPLERIYVEGIEAVAPADIAYARELGHRIKLLAIAKESGGELEARVHPTLIPTDHLLASVGGVYNAIWLHGDAVGSQMFSGRGAGQMPTASAVVSDLVEIAHNIVFGRPSRPSSLALPGEAAELKLRDMARVRSCYYLRVMAIDKPRVLSRISGILGEHNISIASVIQKGRGVHAAVPVVFMTHAALEGDMRKALRTIDHLDVVAQQTTCIRVEGDED